MTSIDTLLVANRGEIARRIFRTARSMGIRCVAVFAAADASAPFVAEADEAIRLPGGYLDQDAIIEAARRTGAGAVHPGYGFLSENADFARAVGQAGMIWVGPEPEAIGAMGDKIAAKRSAVAAGVPVLPSSEDVSQAGGIGYPLLVKASAGGGGKGMRVVDSAASLAEAVASAQREALGGFGDETVFLERYVARARHVEIQILGDAHGQIVHLGERECSIQRRHQKIIEESPSPIVDDAMREAMGSAAVALAKAMNYRSAGTVEFLVDDDSREFFFLEVNTRLQVEHPVTELVTGIDLVREQLRIAAGEALGYGQDDIVFSGHAIEARLYAEDPAAGFLPATGTLTAFAPRAEPEVRWDSGVEAGSTIGTDFDPMLAKVIAHGPTRSEAASRLALALERCHLGGVTTNRDFLAATLRHEAFIAGDTTTDFIARVAPVTAVGSRSLQTAAIAAAMWTQGANRSVDRRWGFAPSNWRNAGLPPTLISFDAGSEGPIDVAYRSARDGVFTLTSGETVTVVDWQDGEVTIEIDRRRHTSRITRTGADLHVQIPGTTITLQQRPRFPLPGMELPTGGLVAPMPGAVIDVRCALGDQVAAGSILVVLEAMKMEHHITAPFDGTVSKLSVKVGDHVDNGQLLLAIDEIDQEQDT